MFINYFYPNRELDYIDKLKTVSFIGINLIGIVLSFLSILLDLVYSDIYFTISFFSKISIVVFLIFSLFLLKKKGIKYTGNVYSVSIVAILLFWMNIFDDSISPLYKFLHGYYSIFALFALGSIFANRRVIIINTILVLLTTTRIYLYTRSVITEDVDMITSAYVTHSTIVIVTALIIYFVNKFTLSTIRKINDDKIKIEIKNQELIASEEEIRATNEELIVTTDALKENQNELIIAKEKAEESDRLKTKFLNNMSHEVRTPLNGILGFTDLLNNPDLDYNTKKEYIQVINQSSHQLLKIIDDIVEISKLETQQHVINSDKVDINKITQELLLEYTAKNSKNIKLNLLNGLPDNDCQVIIDGSKLYRILNNLLENAYKFTEKGNINFGYHVMNNTIKFYVKDTGIGIDRSKQEDIFKCFTQENSDTSIIYGGLGLGLSISKEYVKLLNGDVTLSSEKGKGTEINITVPYIPV